MILQRSQIFLTDARTFMRFPWCLCQPLKDPPPTGVGGGKLDLDSVPGEDPHRLEAGLSCRMAEHLVSIRQLDPVERVGKGFDNPPHERLAVPGHRAHRIWLEDSQDSAV
jgi:hypothetical protein